MYYTHCIYIICSLRALPSYKVIDFHKVEGLKGAYIASQINSQDQLESFITFDKGGVWQHLVPPSRTFDGHPVRCEWVCLECIDMFTVLNGFDACIFTARLFVTFGQSVFTIPLLCVANLHQGVNSWHCHGVWYVFINVCLSVHTQACT